MEFTGLDATGRVVFRRDHKVVDLFSEGDGPNARWVATSWGKWLLEGNEIITDEEMLLPDYSSSERNITRIPVREFEEDRLVRADGRADFMRVKLDAERYSQMVALLYVIASIVAFASIIFAMRNTSFRKEVILLGVTAVVALAWSTSTLVAELAQTGTVIISAASLRALRFPTEILRVVCILVFMIGLVKLIFALRKSEGSQS